jgi:hypothetical protein
MSVASTAICLFGPMALFFGLEARLPERARIAGWTGSVAKLASICTGLVLLFAMRDDFCGTSAVAVRYLCVGKSWMAPFLAPLGFGAGLAVVACPRLPYLTSDWSKKNPSSLKGAAAFFIVGWAYLALMSILVFGLR